MNHRASYDRISFVPTVDTRDGEILLYGRMEELQNIPPDQRVGARIGSKDRCTNCGKPFTVGQHITADLAPNMAGTAYHTDCVHPTNPGGYDARTIPGTIQTAHGDALWAGFVAADNCYTDPKMDVIDTGGDFKSFDMEQVVDVVLGFLAERGYRVVADESRVSDERMRCIREVCLNCLNRDVPGSDRYWLADSVLNIMNGTIDEQIRYEMVARDLYHSDPSDPT